MDELRRLALFWLSEPDPVEKVGGVAALAKAWNAGSLRLDTQACLTENSLIPGRPVKPELVSPRVVKQRGAATIEGRAALIHALAHIEFNAINLALDVIWRFSGMPQEYYSDWLRVASEEALHFSLLSAHLQTMGYAYGDFPAHNGLWEMAEKTKDDLLARIALVPRTMEARGLDVSPPIRTRLADAGDAAGAEILDIILRDEIGHVAIGNRWYAWMCHQRGLEAESTYFGLLEKYDAPAIRRPINMEARRKAGFGETELSVLISWAGRR